VWSVRKAGLDIVMSMAGPRKPISFIEDCAVPLEHLTEYARRVEEIFGRHDTDGTWYAHASVGCLHVRPALNLKDPDDVARVRRIAEEVHEVVRDFGGTHSGEHGDGILRSEFLRSMVGDRLTEAYAEVKRTFDPDGIMNPGKIVDPPRMDDRSLFRYGPDYTPRTPPVVLDWSEEGGLLGAVERCNNNGACRAYDPGVMCPSFRVTHDERHSTRGRANALRLALTGQLGLDGLDTPEMAEAMALCISCKACKRECPTGVDMARVKLEWQHRRNQRLGVPLRERVLASLPRIAPRVSRAAPLLNAGGRTPLTRLLGIARERALPQWHRDPWRDTEIVAAGEPEVALFVDTFTRWFEPEQARAAYTLLSFGGRTVASVAASPGERPLCCGRTYLSAGMLDEARTEATRLLRAVAPLARAGVPIVGLEPSCLYTLLDEIPSLLPSDDARVVAEHARLLEDFLDDEWSRGRTLPFGSLPGTDGEKGSHVLVHGHCHQKAFRGVDATLSMLERVPGLRVDAIEAGCCGMAGSFGYHAEHYHTSMAMGELELLPAIRDADAGTRIVADGTSCRAQIAAGTGRDAVHAVVVLADALGTAAPTGV
jgi:Fe-S oxidoreductase